jgi:hypothetical protein
LNIQDRLGNCARNFKHFSSIFYFVLSRRDPFPVFILSPSLRRGQILSCSIQESNKCEFRQAKETGQGALWLLFLVVSADRQYIVHLLVLCIEEKLSDKFAGFVAELGTNADAVWKGAA